ncbi:MAG TPA: aminotransferase class V-fold PLP-dependent enzyme [Planctomicrobium sp.]|nr:aminotransferase class V-fold PLP-dependent enzyme [Planctomicrobium sp.]
MIKDSSPFPLMNAQYWTGKTYLNTAAEGLPLQACADAVGRYLQDKSTGEPGRVKFWEQYQLTRSKAARLFNVQVDQTALVSSTTEALNTIAYGIDWQPGDEVVFTSVEFPSNMFPWVVLQKQGVVTKVVTPRQGKIWTEDLLEQITPRTRLVTVSQVSYASGQHINPRPLWERVSGTPTLLCVDATQAAARVPVDGNCADFTIASTFKWMNSIHGAAIMTVSPRVLTGEFSEHVQGPAGWLSTENCFGTDRLERFHPRADAQRFQAGMPNFDSLYSLGAALEFHAPERVTQRRQDLEPLVMRLYEEFRELGLNVLVPEQAEDRAGIVPFSCDDSTQVRQQLAEQNIFVQGDDRRIRAAIHWYNTTEDIENLIQRLKPLIVKR